MPRFSQVFCVAWVEANREAEVNEGKADVKCALERDGYVTRFNNARHAIATGTIMIPQEVPGMNVTVSDTMFMHESKTLEKLSRHFKPGVHGVKRRKIPIVIPNRLDNEDPFSCWN